MRKQSDRSLLPPQTIIVPATVGERKSSCSSTLLVLSSIIQKNFSRIYLEIRFRQDWKEDAGGGSKQKSREKRKRTGRKCKKQCRTRAEKNKLVLVRETDSKAGKQAAAAAWRVCESESEAESQLVSVLAGVDG